MTSLVINKMRENRYGRIIHISSVNGQKGQFGQTNYAATKSALLGFSKSLALESANKGITSNVICPGYINTEMVAAIREDILKSIVETIPNKRLGEADEVAEMLTMVLSMGILDADSDKTITQEELAVFLPEAKELPESFPMSQGITYIRALDHDDMHALAKAMLAKLGA